MSIISGIRSGLRSGIRAGLNPGTGAGDGPSGSILVPMTGPAFLAATGRTPTHAYSCQEASGNLIDQIGSVNLVPAGAPLFLQPVSNWVRKGVGFNETVNQRFSVAAGTGWNVTLTPVAMLAYVTARTAAAVRSLLIITDAGGTARSGVSVTTGGLLRTQCGSTLNDGTIDHRDAAVHPVLLTIDVGGSVTNRYTNIEKDNGTFGAGAVDGTKGIGAYAGLNSHLGEVLALWVFEGSDAQFSDAQAKTMLTNLGWSGIPWS